ncbi:hypothetical protein ACL9RJ_19340 [Pseudomonas sp. Mn2068]|uniref:hypothetical protein n=1 Tax=Pseudomonas sp. Mn2068 TaxID=3395265 RepID=UPI003BEB5792
MRYLRVTAQDRSGSGKADSVLLHFYQKNLCEPDEVVGEAIALDISGDGLSDFAFAADINRDGQIDQADIALLKLFANTYLQLNWFNKGASEQRVLCMFVGNHGKNGKPSAVCLQFRDRCEAGGKQSLVYSATAYDGGSNGRLDSFSNTDLDRNGVADKADKELLKTMASTYLQFKWHEK